MSEPGTRTDRVDKKVAGAPATSDRGGTATRPAPIWSSQPKPSRAQAVLAFTRAAFAVSWTTMYPSLLSSADGSLVTRHGYATRLNEPGLGLPWQTRERRVGSSPFWTYYLDSSARLLGPLHPDVAWDHLIPFHRIDEPDTVIDDLGGQASAAADVLIYPSSVSVVIRVTASGSWPLAQLAPALAAMRVRKRWTLQTQGALLTSGNLDRIAGVLRDRTALLLTDGDLGDSTPPIVVTVAAPLSAEATDTTKGMRALDVTNGNDDARACLAGLARLEPKGDFDEDRLLKKNESPKRSGRVYALRKGHAIWYEDYLLDHPDGVRPGRLLRNHTDLVTHIAALEGIVSWAAKQLNNSVRVPVAVQPLIKRAALRLRLLYKAEATYRAEVAEKRIEPICADLNAIDRELP
jgi:hypothetical protein